MRIWSTLLIAAPVAAGLLAAPAAQADWHHHDDWHGGGGWHGNYHHDHDNGGAVAGAILGLGAAAVLGGVIAAITCILGHNYTIWLGFKGGKGIATSGGVILALFPIAVVCCLALVWIAVFYAGRYVSLASIAAAVGLPVGLILAGLDRKNLPHQHWVGYGLSGRRLHPGARESAILAHL